MRNTLMICASVAALVAAGGLASAQGMKEQPPAAAEQKAPEGKTDRQHVTAPPKSESMKPAPTAQAPEGKADQKRDTPQKVEAVKPAPTAQAPEGKADRKHDAPQKVETVKPAPSAQAPEHPTAAKPERVGQGGGTQPSPHNAQSPSDRTAPNAAAPVESKAGAPTALSAEHRTQFRETIRSEKVAPLSDVHFSVTIGQPVPRTVHLNRLPARVIEYAPQYRDYEYILVGDEILIVDPRTLMIVAVISA
jgi:hypothetical protein